MEGFISKIIRALEKHKQEKHEFGHPRENVVERMKDKHKDGYDEPLDAYISRIPAELKDMIFDNQFMSSKVVEYVKTNNLVYKIYKKDNITIHLWYDGKTHKPTTELLNKMLMLCYAMRSLSSSDSKIVIRFVYTPFKKEYPPKGQPITQDNVNTGSALSGVFINLWRSEEILKVLIHELVHYLNLDVPHEYNNKLLDYYSKFTSLDGFDSPCEAYTELIAVLVHSIFICLEKGKKTKEDIKKCIEDEIQFTLLQMAKILSHFDIESFDGVFGNKKGNKIKQTTSVLSYYIVKGAMLYNLNDSLEYLNKYFGNFDLDEYIKLLNRSLNNELMKNDVKKRIMDVKGGIIAHNTLKMTFGN